MIPFDKSAYELHFYGKAFAYHSVKYGKIFTGFGEDQYLQIQNGSTIAVCPVNSDNKSSYLVFDFDGPKDGGKKALPFVKQFKKLLLEKGLKPTIFFSGSKGFHVYLFFDNLVNSHLLKIYGEKIREEYTSTTDLDDIKIEIFPKQTVVDWKNRQYGNHLKAPLCVHPETKERSIQLTDYALNESKQLEEYQDNVIKTVDAKLLATLLLPYFVDGCRHNITLGVTGYMKYHHITKEIVTGIFDLLIENTNADKEDIYRVIADTYSSEKIVADLAYAKLPKEVEVYIFSFVSGIEKPGIKTEVYALRSSKQPPHIKVDKCVELAIKYLSTAYRLFTDGVFIYIIYGEKLYTDQDTSFDSLLLRMGFNRDESFSKQVRYAIVDWIKYNGIKIHPIMYSRFTDNQLHVYTKEKVYTVTGKDDKEEKEFLPVLKFKDFTQVKHTRLLRKYIKDYGLDDRDTDIIIVWLVAQLFSDSLKTKPILFLQGPPQCGKTTLATLLLRLIESFDSDPIAFSGKDDSFTASLAIHKVLVLDNLEFIKPEMVDRLNSITTGTQIELRRLYTTNETVKVKPTCSVIITSAYAQLNNDGALQSRLIRIRMGDRSKFWQEERYWKQVKEDYNNLYSELLSYARLILNNKEREYTYNLRFTDFLRISKILYDYNIIGLDIEKTLMYRQAMSKIDNIYYQIFYHAYGNSIEPFSVEKIFAKFAAIANGYGVKNLNVGTLTTQLLKTGLFQKLMDGKLVLNIDFKEIERLKLDVEQVKPRAKEVKPRT